MEKFMMSGNIPLHVYDSEKGDNVIVLLHGYLETLSVWDNFSEALTKAGYRVIAIDLPGHGLSGSSNINTMEFMADRLNDILDKINVAKCLLVGHSLGGYVSLAFAKKYPDKTSGLCLFHSTPNPDTDEKKANRDREIEAINEGKLDTIINLSIPNTFAPDNVKRMSEKIQEIKENASIAEPNGIIACLQGMKTRDDMNLFLKEFTKPLLFIFGAKDNYISVEVANTLIERFPQAEHLILENSGHAGFIEQPEVSLEAIDGFARKVFR